ncbi:MAG: quaternary ammonium compound efflux SMR transporter SugE [Myxococcales bacterium]|nr:quaternary ammonium compound efflux SMR transporter SugE [Myxococcales bacterium]
MSWLLVVLSGLVETAWAIGLTYSKGFTRPLPTVLTLTGMVVSVLLLGIAARTLPIGTAYAVWVGIGAVGTAVLGMIVLGEPANAQRVLSLALILAGIIGLKLAG